MMRSKLICLAACLAILFAPLFLGICLDGKAHAMGFLGDSDSNSRNNSGSTAAPAVTPTPEPATLLLFGAGAVGLAVARKKFKKK